MTIRFRYVFKAALTVLAVVGANGAFANTVNFVSVADSRGLFGSYAPVNDSLYFGMNGPIVDGSPFSGYGFGVLSFEGTGFNSLGASESTLFDTVTVVAKTAPGYVFTGLRYSETLVFERNGGFTYTAVSGSVAVNSDTPILFDPGSSAVNGLGSSSGLNFASISVAGSLSGDTATIVISNSLTALAFGPSSSAFILKFPYSILSFETVPVPIPASVWLLGSGLLGLGVGRFRRWGER